MNVILIVCDTWRRDHIGAYGNEWIRTPNTDRLAARGTVFDNAYLGSFPTLPCRREIATGRYEFPWRGWGGLDIDDVTLSTLATRAGKTSFFITDVFHHWGRDAGNFWRDFTGFEIIRGQEADGLITDTDNKVTYPAEDCAPPRPVHIHFKNAAYLFRDEKDWFSPRVFSTATRWIQHNADHEDFFLMIDCFDPHEPWDPPRYYVDLYDDPAYDGVEYKSPGAHPVEGHMTEAEFRHAKALYAGEVSLMDRWLGHFLDQVELMGLMDDTMIILTTDHGTYLGDHGYLAKHSLHLYDCLSHIPLIIYHPTHGHGERRDHLVQLVDLFPTILEGLGIDVPKETHGRSLSPVLESAGAGPVRDVALFGWFCHAINLFDGEHALYQVPDPSNPPLYSHTPILPKWNTKDWGPFDGTRRLVGEKDRVKGLRNDLKSALHHLPTDPAEARNLIDEKPEVRDRLRRRIAEYLGEIGAPEELVPRFALQDYV